MKHIIKWRSMDSAPKEGIMLLKSHTGRIGAGYVGIGTAMHLFENPIGWLPMPTNEGFEVETNIDLELLRASVSAIIANYDLDEIGGLPRDLVKLRNTIDMMMPESEKTT